jgi:hypothetical protein
MEAVMWTTVESCAGIDTETASMLDTDDVDCQLLGKPADSHYQDKVIRQLKAIACWLPLYAGVTGLDQHQSVHPAARNCFAG